MLESILRLLRAKAENMVENGAFQSMVDDAVILSVVDTSWHGLMPTDESKPLVLKEDKPHEHMEKWECNIKALDGHSITLLLDTCACSMKSLWKALHTPGRDLPHVVGVVDDPGGSHWDALISRYWKGLRKCDVDMVCDVDTCKSTHGFMHENAMRHSHQNLLYALHKCLSRVLQEHCRQSMGVG